MLGFLILMACQLLSVYSVSIDVKARKMKLDNFWGELLSGAIFFPLAGEMIFRYLYKEYFGTSNSSLIINVILFSLVCSFNHMLHRTPKTTLIQIVTTAYLGYYLFSFDSLSDYLWTHAYYNTEIVILSYWLIPKLKNG